MNSPFRATGGRWVQLIVWLLCVLGALSVISCGGSGSGTSGTSGSTSGVEISITPPTTVLAPGLSYQFQATVTGSSNTGVSWSATAGTVSSTGVYVAPVTPGSYRVTATSVADTTKSVYATVTVQQNTQSGVTVAVIPPTATVATGGQAQFSATVTGSSNQTVTWTASSGTIDSTGLFTAGSQNATVTIRATSVAVPTVSGAATVTVTYNGPVVQISPLSTSVPILGTAQFNANILNSSNQTVTWTATGGTINPQGLFTAGGTVGIYQVTATSAQNPSLSATATIKVTPVTVLIYVNNYTMVVGQQMQCTAKISGFPNQSVTWSASAGTISSTGLFTAPSTPQSVTITATSAQVPGYTGSTTETVVNQTDDLYNFNSGIPAVWTPAQSAATPSGINFLGAFGQANTATLSLSSLSPHTTLTLKFSVFIIGGWTGSTPLAVTVDGSSVFSQSFSNVSGDNQTYPNGASTNLPGTGAAATNTLGYTSSPSILYNDSTYDIVISNIPHTASTVTVIFSSNLTGTASQMSWGLQNCELIANP